MGAYEDVRDDVHQQFEAVLDRQRAVGTQESVALPEVPAVSVSGSKPAWLSDGWRAFLTIASLVASVLGLGLMWSFGYDASGPAVVSGLFAITALVVAYLTVGGFGTVAFSIGTGKDSGTDKASEESDS